ncbi:hypothetical protein BpPP18_07640 [Weizmannia acidilactici]|nr:hypothetical protein BpPP18_07640 [Weizmannia acidilactici]
MASKRCMYMRDKFYRNRLRGWAGFLIGEFVIYLPEKLQTIGFFVETFAKIVMMKET